MVNALTICSVGPHTPHGFLPMPPAFSRKHRAPFESASDRKRSACLGERQFCASIRGMLVERGKAPSGTPPVHTPASYGILKFR